MRLTGPHPRRESSHQKVDFSKKKRTLGEAPD